ncbi:tetratricopeptide repeat protein [Aquisalimonas sp.]|uniref:tetratricopeptide repeat protein n=1 Tax=unclassified Aquisalimonas TaxID=2644645 RepID=UPI0025C0CB7E|nr:tetratricopeptide repeat protein [Aquisalimonas sp.]
MPRLAALFAILFSATTLAATPDEAYRDGMAAFNAGDFQSALAAFERARDGGKDTPQLHFNLGVTHYHLDQLEQADKAFARAARAPELAGIAHYNRGRVATRDDRPADAETHYRAALEHATTERIRELARAALDATREAVPDPPARPGPTALAEVGVGYDSNTALQGDDRPDTGSRGDAFVDLLFYGDVQPLGTADRGLRVHGLLNGVRHPDNRGDNFDRIETGVTGFRTQSGWQQEVGTSLSRARLEGDPLETAVEAHGQVGRPLGDTLHGSLRYRLAWIESGEAFDGLDGVRHDLRARLRGRLANARWRLDYTLEWNDRDDIPDGDGIISYSPVRHGIRARWSQPLTESLEGGIHGSLRYSRYPDREDTGDGLERRSDLRAALGAELRHDLGGGFSALARLDWTDNHSAIDRYRYDRLRGGIALEYFHY